MSYKQVFTRPVEKVRKRNQIKSKRRKIRKNQSKKIAADSYVEKAKTKNIFEAFNN